MILTFHDVYLKRMNERYRNHVWRKYGPFIEFLEKEITQGGMLFSEWGCGAANISRFLGDKCLHLLIDSDPRMLRLARMNMGGVYSKIWYKEADIRDEFVVPTLAGLSIDVIHSHGVLEHFEDQDIRAIIDNQKRRASTLIHYVPSHRYEKPSFGTERLLSPERWLDICAPTEITPFNDGYDLILTWR